jgi:hypothetical protein
MTAVDISAKHATLPLVIPAERALASESRNPVRTAIEAGASGVAEAGRAALT